MSSDIRIEEGSYLIFRAYDVAEEISLPRAETLVSESRGQARVSLARRKSSTLIIRDAPLMVNLGEVELPIFGEGVRVEATAKIWSYGVISIRLTVPMRSGSTWQELIEMASLIEARSEINKLCRALTEELLQEVRSAAKKAHAWEVDEDYVIYFIKRVSDGVSAKEIVAQADVASLILPEPQMRLAPSHRERLLKSSFQYADDDIVVVNWDSALVVEPSGEPEIPLVLEFALTQLLEFRYYDDLLDRQLTELYDSMQEGRRGWRNRRKGDRRSWRRRRDLAQLSREASTLFIEFAELTEQVDNSFKAVGDSYLAEIFRAAVNSFRLQDWKGSITRKMNLLAQTSQLLQGDINTQISHIMELIIILLIAAEILAAALKWF